MLKTAGYLVSTVSVLLLALVSLKAAREEPRMLAVLIAGAGASILGMILRWLAYRREQTTKVEPASLSRGDVRE